VSEANEQVRGIGQASPETLRGAQSTYRDAGVDIEAGDAAVERIRSHVASTTRPGVLGGVGGFGGLFDLAALSHYRDPLLVSSTDGVGTKALVAAELGVYDTLGFDLVAMCADDLVCTGAEPLFFLDYVLVGRLDPALVEQVVTGLAAACREVGAAIVGGEMAEHPGQLPEGELDLAGFCVGAVERDRLLPQRVEPGCALVGLASPNLRSNGFSLVRRVFAGRPLGGEAWPGAGRTLGQVLLEPSVLFAPHARRLLEALDVRALAHITGGGMVPKLGRVVPDGCVAVVDRSSWEPPRIFTEVQRAGGISDDEMAAVFNLGIGMVAVVPAEEAAAACGLVEGARVIGEIVAAAPGDTERVAWAGAALQSGERRAGAALQSGERPS
jgi:phosphoribosylformylglycinamidine cyclo-ligase